MPYFIYFVIIVGFVDNFAQLPVIAPYAKDLGGSSLWIGLVVAIYSLSNLVGNLLSGRWMDRWGRKGVVLIGMILAACSLVAYALASSVQQLAAVRFLHGLGGGLLVPALFALLGDRTSGDGHGRTMAVSGAAIGIAAILGPAYGGVLGQRLGLDWLFFSLAALMLVTALAVGLFLTESYRVSEGQSGELRQLVALLKEVGLIQAYLGAFGQMFGIGILTYALPLKVETLGYGSALTGALMSLYGVVAITFFLLPTNQISDRIGRLKPMLFGLFFIAVAFLCLSVADTLFTLVCGMVLFGFGFSFLFPAMTARVMDLTDTTERGRAFGLFYAFFSLGVIVGPVLVGWLGVTFDQSFIVGAIGLVTIGVLILAGQRVAAQKAHL